MKRLATIFTASVVALGAIAQGNILGQDKDIYLEDVSVRADPNDIFAVQNALSAQWFNPGAYYTVPQVGSGRSGLYGKVEAKVRVARPKRSGSSASSSRTRRVGSYNYQTSDSHMQWLENKREREAQAREAAAEKKRQERIQRKIADDNRAAEVTAATNARLQVETNRRIARDHYHAGAGAVAAQQRARRAVRRVGPNFAPLTPTMTAQEKAGILRRRAKPRRTMRSGRNTSRQVLAPTQRTPATEEQLAMRAKWLEKAQAERKIILAEQKKRAEEQRKRYMASNKVKEPEKAKHLRDGEVLVNNAFVLGPHAHSTLGQDWGKCGPSLTPPPVPSYPVDPESRRRHKEWMDLVIKECLPL